jgi:methylsterol monooxygenase
MYMQNDALATGVLSFVMHEVVYVGRSVPWIIIDAIPWFRKYKIQHVCVIFSRSRRNCCAMRVGMD